MQVLFPTDFSDNSKNALPFAVDLCKKTQGTLKVLSVYNMAYGEHTMNTASLLDALKKNTEEKMKAFETVLKAQNITFTTAVRLGSVSSVVKEEAKNQKAQLIVMGTQGASGLEEILVGSNTASVIQAVSIPVLAIPAEAAFKPIKKIVFCTELESLENEEVLERLKAIATLYNASVDFLHIQDEAKKGAREHILKHFDGIKVNFTIMKREDIEEAVLNHANSANADVIGVMTKNYSFFERLFHSSLANKLAFHSHIPVLVFHQN